MSFRNSRRKERRLLPGEVYWPFCCFAISIALFALFFPCLGGCDGDADGLPDLSGVVVVLPAGLLLSAALPAAFPAVLVVPVPPVEVSGLPSLVTVNYKSLKCQKRKW